MSVERCPVCYGTGNVCGDFYSSCPGGMPVSVNSMETCRACNGRGIIEHFERGLKECETKEETEKLYQFGDTEDKITVLKDIRGHLVTIIEELQKIRRNV